MPLAGDCHAAGMAEDPGDRGENRKRLPDPAAALRNKATKSPSESRRLSPATAARGSRDNPG